MADVREGLQIPGATLRPVLTYEEQVAVCDEVERAWLAWSQETGKKDLFKASFEGRVLGRNKYFWAIERGAETIGFVYVSHRPDYEPDTSALDLSGATNPTQIRKGYAQNSRRRVGSWTLDKHPELDGVYFFVDPSNSAANAMVQTAGAVPVDQHRARGIDYNVYILRRSDL